MTKLRYLYYIITGQYDKILIEYKFVNTGWYNERIGSFIKFNLDGEVYEFVGNNISNLEIGEKIKNNT